MSISKRLFSNNVKIILVSIVLLVGISYFWSSFFFAGYDIKPSLGAPWKNPISSALKARDEIFSGIKNTSLLRPSEMSDKKALVNFDKKLSEINVGIIVRKNEELFYTTNELKGKPILKTLPAFATFFQDSYNVFETEKSGVILGQHDFYYVDGSQGSIFLISTKDQFTTQVRKVFMYTIISTILLILLTNFVLTMLVGQGIIKPLKKLKEAAEAIKNGNLDKSIYDEDEISKRNNSTPKKYKKNKYEEKDEIAELKDTFEEMRIKLKESMEAQLLYEENRKELISNISHDLKTPITAIKGYIQGISDGVADSPEKMEKYLATISRRTAEMDNLINELFLYSKLDLHKEKFDFVKVRVDRFVSDIVEEMRFDFEKIGGEISLEKELFIDKNAGNETESYILADVQHLKRVISNIIDNSIKYKSNDFIKVDVKMERIDKKVRISIADNGIGINEDAIKNIFERFYRENNARTTDKPGSGLGLSIAKKIVEEHKGEIWATSEYGVGTTIFIELPLTYKEVE